jgi:tetratricopeptide (TPR) repeat protein
VDALGGRTWRRGSVAFGALLLAGGVAMAAARGLEARAPAPIGDAQLVYLPDAARLRPLALGYDTVLANLLWFRTISYFGAHLETDRAYPWLEAMCDLVTDLHPRAFHAYQFAGLILPWEARDPDAGIRLLEKGLRHFPDSWLLHYYLGVVHYLFQGDTEQAAEHLEHSARLPDAPPLVGGFAAMLRTSHGNANAAIAILEQMLEAEESPTARAALERNLLETRVARDLDLLTTLVRAYRDRHGALPADLDALVAAGLLRAVPPDRYGGVYVIDPATATVRSSTGREPRRLHESPIARQLRDRTATPGDDA